MEHEVVHNNRLVGVGLEFMVMLLKHPRSQVTLRLEDKQSSGLLFIPFSNKKCVACLNVKCRSRRDVQERSVTTGSGVEALLK